MNMVDLVCEFYDCTHLCLSTICKWSNVLLWHCSILWHFLDI